ncbi:MAG: ribonuclease III [Bacteroides sp.]|nr:ribonuclease III [Bacteroides sp.]
MRSCNLIDKIRLLFRKDRESYLCFYAILGFYPHDIRIYRQALLHKSTSLRSEKGRPLNNERLEFLGDAILDAIVGDIVYRHFEGRREGFLTNTRSKIVQRETLNKLAVEIGLDKLVKSSTRTSSHNSYMYGNAFEAFIGAIYLDQGYERCKQFMEEKIFKSYIDLDKMSRKEVNFKSKLIEWSQKNKMEVSFELIEQFLDKDYNPMFHTEVRIAGLSAGKGTGYSKKESQQNAAQAALKKLKSDATFKAEIEAAHLAMQQPEQEEEAPIQPASPLPTDAANTATDTPDTIDTTEPIASTDAIVSMDTTDPVPTDDAATPEEPRQPEETEK